MRYNSRYYGTTYQERQKMRADSKANKASFEQSIADAQVRLVLFFAELEASFKEEAEALHERIVSAWHLAFAKCTVLGFDYNAVVKAITGVDLSKGLPEYDSNPRSEQHKIWCATSDMHNRAKRRVNEMMEGEIISLKLTHLWELDEHANTCAAKIVEECKGKLFYNAAKYLKEFQTIEVAAKHIIRTSVKGFTGKFQITTDKGARTFETQCVPVQGPIKCFHYRYIARVS